MSDIKLFNGDAYKLIKNIPDNSIDLVLTDPPYVYELNGGHSNCERFTKCADAFTKELGFIAEGFDLSILDEYLRVLKKPNMYIWCSNKQVRDLLNYFDSKGLTTQIIIWYKTNAVPLCGGTYMSDKEFCIFARGKGVPLYGTPETKKTVYSTPINQADKKLYDHPTIKPLDIIKNLVTNSTSKGQVVLDTFMGSGTTGCACKLTGRDFIGFEMESKYFDIAKKRIENTNAFNEKPNIKNDQMTLFDLFEKEDDLLERG